MQPMLLAFLKELFQRLATKSPKFFRIVQLISGGFAVITGIPEFLDFLGIALSPTILFFENKAVAFASAGAFFISLLTTQSPTVGITEGGDLLKKTDDKLTFTTQTEMKAAIKSGVIDEVIRESSTTTPPL